MFARFDDVYWFAAPRTPPIWQRGFFLVNCLVLRRLLASVRSGVVKTFRYVPQTIVDSTLSLADLSTRKPFRDAEPRPIADVGELRRVVVDYSTQTPRVLQLSTPTFEVYFGTGCAVSFIECVNFKSGQARYPILNAPDFDFAPGTFVFDGGYEQLTPPPTVWLSMVDVLRLLLHVAEHDAVPDDVEWKLTPDWYAGGT